MMLPFAPSRTPYPPDWIVPDWPAPANVRAVFTTRSGGVSAPPFDSFNLGDHVRDDPQAVAINRQRLAAVTGARPVFLQQVHGTSVVVLNARTAHGAAADAVVTTDVGVACTVMVADCLPVLLTHRAGTVVAAAHAGWRGLAQGVLEECFSSWLALAQQQPSATQRLVMADVMAWLGPCIGPQAFEVGGEVRAAFMAWRPETATCFTAGPTAGKYLANLPQLARLRLQAMGIGAVYGNDGEPTWCTVTQSSRFFSHRRDAFRLGSSGRMAACIWRV